MSSQDPPSTPLVLGHGRYQVVEPIGQGGVGTVYRARDRAGADDVAIKVLQPRLVGTKVERRFLREADVMSRLNHPNVVRVLDIGRDGQHAWMAMELMDRGNAHALARKRNGLPVRWCLHIADCVLAGLAAVHQAGWVHRDVKPGNILLDHTGVVKLGDFGILRDEESDLTCPGMPLGTTTYMAPEQQVDATRVTPRSDLYALGASLFALATARTPKRLAMMAFRGAPAEDPFQIGPRPLQPLIRRSCQVDPAHRFADAADMRRAVREILVALQRHERLELSDRG